MSIDRAETEAMYEFLEYAPEKDDFWIHDYIPREFRWARAPGNEVDIFAGGKWRIGLVHAATPSCTSSSGGLRIVHFMLDHKLARKHIVPADLRDIGDYTDKMSASAEIEEIKNASGQPY